MYINLICKVMKCEYCNNVLVDDENAITNYLIHKRLCHKDEVSDEELLFDDYREKMIRQKKEFIKSKEKMGDSDLIFNAQERDVHNDNEFTNPIHRLKLIILVSNL